MQFASFCSVLLTFYRTALDLAWLFSAGISADQLRSASDSIQPVKINLGRPKFVFDSAHVKPCDV